MVKRLGLSSSRFLFYLYFILLFLHPDLTFSQITKIEEELISPSRSMLKNLDYRIDFSLTGFASTKNKLPFWMFHNNRGRYVEDSNISSLLSAKHVIFFGPHSYLISGIGINYTDGAESEVEFDELYSHFQNQWLYITFGIKQQREWYNGLSSSNRSILWSLNAPPLPGIQIGTTRPIFFSGKEGLGFEASWNDYWLEHDRYVRNAKLHYKRFFLVYRKNSFQVKGGLHHFVQWAGTSPEEGKQPNGFDNYLRVIMGRKGSTDANIGDQQNALGNTLGGYELSISNKFRKFKLAAFYNHLFEDGSGMMLRNTPDGRYGIFYEADSKKQLINSVIYELTYSQHHSYTFPTVDGPDNYFRHGVYKSGWTYKDRILGSPFFTLNPEGEGLINDKFTAHHIGLGGTVKHSYTSYPYKLLLSYARNDGTYEKRFRPKQDVFYFLTEISAVVKGNISITLLVGGEYDSYKPPIYGLGINFNYKL